jgi:hypothetical protein
MSFPKGLLLFRVFVIKESLAVSLSEIDSLHSPIITHNNRTKPFVAIWGGLYDVNGRHFGSNEKEYVKSKINNPPTKKINRSTADLFCLNNNRTVSVLYNVRLFTNRYLNSTPCGPGKASQAWIPAKITSRRVGKVDQK